MMITVVIYLMVIRIMRMFPSPVVIIPVPASDFYLAGR
jgi:hypothetical protein